MEIREFVLLEESSISKGIRRIVAVTGDAAYQASRIASEIEKRVQALRNLKPLELEIPTKAIKAELERAQISLVKKNELKGKISEYLKKYLEAEKVLKAAQLKEVEYVIIGFSCQAIARIEEEVIGKEYVVSQFEGLDSKSLNSIITSIKSKNPKIALMVLNVDKSSSKISHQCVVSKDLNSNGLLAVEWASVVADKIGGKKGGTGESAQGMGTDMDSVDAAVEAANLFAKLKLDR